MKKTVLSVSALLLACTSVFAQEQDKNEQLDEVVISDSRHALKRENSGKTVISISSEEIKKNQGKTVAEVINTKSGIEILGSRSNAGQNLSYFVRGGNNRQVLILIDGIQVNDPSSIANDFDLRLIALDQIESIEIVKGASSTLYGSGAATAVISITTKKASEDTIALRVNSSFGTNQSQDDSDYNVNDFSNSVRIDGTVDGISYVVGFGHQNTDGLSAVIGEESDRFSRINTNVRIGYKFSDAFEASVFGNMDKFKSDFDSSFPIADADFTSESEQYRFGIAPKYTYKNGSVTLNAAYTKIDREFKSNFPSTFEGETIALDVFNKYNFSNKFYTVVGLNYIDNQTLFLEEQSSSIVDPYLNVVYVSDVGLNVNAGGRLNNHSEYGTHFTYNLNPSYRMPFGKGYAKAFASYSTSFIAPSLSQLFGNFGANPNLSPEENTTLEGGVEVKFSDKLRVSAVYFNRTEENFIDYVVTDFVTFAGEYQNIGAEFTVNGFEFEVAATPIKNLTVNANYTFTEKKDVKVLRIPKHKANLNVAYAFTPKTNAGISYQFTSERLDTDFSTFQDATLESFSLLGANVNHTFSKRLSGFLTVSNIFNEEYTEIIGFTTRGTNVRIGFSLNL
ncbi:TonB-dependent receptor [Kordia sp. YSTF-M3]|uniref:TonB-dependent receptor n=1 Tax=Kordia aestuariivivens TaxID=2759037 RepID=A0ABR7QE63_9FLAO|nr:TonB-dependent receptor plug domain-containing protein [Kordia aestuariivivens]MBC8756834.1 TonB-dependent receptor [Kordia aestuariivivens]